jgi:nucleotide-binding universal stress UspA family protein
LIQRKDTCRGSSNIGSKEIIMTYASTLTVLTGAKDDAIALTTAAQFARSTGGVARCLLALPMLIMADWAGAVGGVYVTETLVDSIEQSNEEARRQTEALVRDVTVQEGLEISEGGGRIVVLHEQPTSELSFMGEAPLTDLVIVGPSTLVDLGVWSGLISESVMSARIPLLVTRRTASDGVAAIAWDGGEGAGRAVRAALPLLRTASKVIILQDPDNISSRNRTAADPERLIEYLGLHGVRTSEVVRQDKASRDNRLAALCRELDVELLVAGAFSHARLSEEILGGCTESLIGRVQDFNVFLTH